MAWHDGLNADSPQYRIAADTESPLRVLAGPGTGKSYALKLRVMRLLENGESPKGILAVTFTRVAACDLLKEMKAVGVDGCEYVKACTLHSLCFELLARGALLKTTNRVPRCLNKFELDPLLEDLSKRYGDKGERRKRIEAYEAAWARLQTDTPGSPNDTVDLDFGRDLLAWLRFHRGILVGELVPVLWDYLRSNPHAREGRLFSHVLVDEYQDLNRAEQAVIDRLAANGELIIIGDDDQSIYSFKHAHPDGIRKFADSHASARTHGLDECYRCPTTVVEMANALIRRNAVRAQPPRQLTARKQNGPGVVKILQFSMPMLEFGYIASVVQEHINRGLAPGKILVLTPRRLIGQGIRNAIEQRGIAAISCFKEQQVENANARERLSLLKLAVNRKDRVALRWLLGCKSGSFLSNQYAVLRAHCESSSAEPWEVLEQLADGNESLEPLRKKTKNLVGRFEEIRTDIAELADCDLSNLLERWLPGSMNGLEELRELAEQALGEQPESLKDALDIMVDLMTQPEVPDEVPDVRVMSLHMSKGLSAELVIVAGCVEGLIPRSQDDGMTVEEREMEIEEERRLFYVAITRTKTDLKAKQPGTLLITSSATLWDIDAKKVKLDVVRGIGGGMVDVQMSRFIAELGNAVPVENGDKLFATSFFDHDQLDEDTLDQRAFFESL